MKAGRDVAGKSWLTDKASAMEPQVKPDRWNRRCGIFSLLLLAKCEWVLLFGTTCTITREILPNPYKKTMEVIINEQTSGLAGCRVENKADGGRTQGLKKTKQRATCSVLRKI
jgi:hypothetical protein